DLAATRQGRSPAFATTLKGANRRPRRHALLGATGPQSALGVLPGPEDTPAGARTTFPMSWRIGEVWLDTDLLWFRDQPRTPFAAPAPTARGAGALPEPPRL